MFDLCVEDAYIILNVVSGTGRKCLILKFWVKPFLVEISADVNINFKNTLIYQFIIPKTLKYWFGVQQGQSYLIRRRYLFSLGWPPF